MPIKHKEEKKNAGPQALCGYALDCAKNSNVWRGKLSDFGCPGGCSLNKNKTKKRSSEMSDEVKEPEKKDVEKPVEQTAEKKDAGAQSICGWSYASGCGSAVQHLK